MATSPTHADIANCKADLQALIASMMDDHTIAETARYDQIVGQLTEVQQQLAEIGRLFEQGKGALNALKWAGYLVAGVWALATWAKDHIKI